MNTQNNHTSLTTAHRAVSLPSPHAVTSLSLLYLYAGATSTQNKMASMA